MDADDIRRSTREGLLLELYRRHMNALRDGREQERERLFRLIEEFRWAFPDIDAALQDRYGP